MSDYEYSDVEDAQPARKLGQSKRAAKKSHKKTDKATSSAIADSAAAALDAPKKKGLAAKLADSKYVCAISLFALCFYCCATCACFSLTSDVVGLLCVCVCVCVCVCACVCVCVMHHNDDCVDFCMVYHLWPGS
jgi:hypothetical protein